MLIFQNVFIHFFSTTFRFFFQVYIESSRNPREGQRPLSKLIVLLDRQILFVLRQKMSSVNINIAFFILRLVVQ